MKWGKAAVKLNEYYFSDALIKTYISFELFLAELLILKLEEWIRSKKHIDLIRLPDKISGYKEMLERINKGEIESISDPDLWNFIDYETSTTGRIRLLGHLNFNTNELWDVYKKITSFRSDIVHRGIKATFEDYANVFIAVGKILIKYDSLVGRNTV